MCGAIASSLMFAFAPGERDVDRVRALMTAQLGRVLMYIAAGAILGAAGSTIYGAFDHSAAFLVMRWAAAVALGWIGLSVAGFAPSLAIVDSVAAPIAERLRFSSPSPRSGSAGAFGTGLLWGTLPCGMVYGALFYAMLTGGAVRGAAVMAGFGLGTLPSVTAVAFGLSRFRRLAQAPNARLAVGLGMMALAAASVAAPAMTVAGFCFN
jgi:sulfite exporter TauE/SafE